MQAKEQERKHLKAFINKIDSLKESTLIFATKGQVPDLKATTKNGIIGIEHQRLFYPPSNNNIIRQEQEGLRRKVIMQSEKEFGKLSDVSLGVNVYFHTFYALSVDPQGLKLTSNRVEPLAKSIANLVKSKTPDLGYEVELRPTLGDDTFPSGINSILVWHPQDGRHAIWQAPEGGAVARFTPDYIRQQISKKEEKIDRYREECDKIWLLLVADGQQFSTWFDIESSGEAFQTTYSTNFDRVFILDGPDLDMNELKTIPM